MFWPNVSILNKGCCVSIELVYVEKGLYFLTKCGFAQKINYLVCCVKSLEKYFKYW